MAGRPGGKVRIVAMGDSTTAGTPGFLSPIEAPPDGEGNPQSQYAYWVMKEHPDWDVLNRGVNGERTDEILRRFQRDVVDESPKLVVILGGVNDVYQGYPAEFPERNLSAMYARALEGKMVPVACTVLPYNTMGRTAAAVRIELNAWVHSESNRRRIPYCDTAAAAAGRRVTDVLDGSPDGLHPDVQGYRRVGLAVSSAIEAFLKQPGAIRDQK